MCDVCIMRTINQLINVDAHYGKYYYFITGWIDRVWRVYSSIVHHVERQHGWKATLWALLLLLYIFPPKSGIIMPACCLPGGIVRRRINHTWWVLHYRGLPVIRRGQWRLHHEGRNVQHCRSHLPNGGKLLFLSFPFAMHSVFRTWRHEHEKREKFFPYERRSGVQGWARMS